MKTPQIRAKELFKLVNGSKQDFASLTPEQFGGWLRLGKYVLDLEKKWTKVKLNSVYGKLGTILVFCLILGLTVKAGQVRVAWEASPSAATQNNLVYIVYGHTNALSETNLSQALIRANVGTNQTLRIDFTNSGNWFVRVTASAGGVESEPSNELALFVPESPGLLKTLAVQYTFDLTNGAAWLPAGNVFLRLLPNP